MDLNATTLGACPGKSKCSHEFQVRIWQRPQLEFTQRDDDKDDDDNNNDDEDDGNNDNDDDIIKTAITVENGEKDDKG
ncbi:hypothetical protein F0562_025159 [Nyssa sinensis]|uniref:Uncharacterized protein n=1 Tax=Nyssa sinensis TaxID=561372 RepID=A0A5J5BES4_9ASTE|nr:hypothetical protein F0562_025159 [Nyssa sinensis]